jgi:alkylation response protein AidB-like acyl-CoA dehydrogenase
MLSVNHIRVPGLDQERCVDFAPTQEHELLRSAVAEIARSFGHEYYVARARSGEKTDELWDAVAAQGFLGVHVPEEHGGGGAGMVELAIVTEELAAAGCPLLLIVVSAAICAALVARFGTDAQRDAWLPGLAAGEKMAFAITEPDAGSNSHNLTTRATRDGDVFRLRGTKTFISGVDEAPRMLVVTRTGTNDATGKGELSLFVVDTDAPGLERTAIPVEICAPEKQFVLFFDDVEVPADRLLGDEGEGLRQVFFGLNGERITSAALATGIGRYALERATEYARDRQVWEVPIGAHQGIAHPLAAAKVDLELARLMNEKAAWSQDHGADARTTGEAANMAKYAAAEAAMACLDRAIQTHGGNGMTSEYGLADLWGLTRLLRIAPISREMVLNFVAHQSLGLPRSY